MDEPRPPQEELSDEQLAALRQKSLDSLYFFAKGVLGFDWLRKDIHKPICEILERYETDRRVKITLPRGWLKTTLCSQAYPIWRSIRDCNIRVLLAQNTFANAVSKLRTIDAQWKQNELLRALFPELLPDASCVWRKESMCLKRTKPMNESTYEAAGTKTKVTSRHYDLIIEDDTVAPDLDDLTKDNVIPSREDIEQAIGWHKLAPPLLVDPATGQLLVVGTRWYVEDLLSYIEESEGDYYASYERACREDKDGNADPAGHVTYPARFPDNVLAELERSMGPYLFSCLYLNKPVSSADMSFKREWITYYDTEPRDLITYTTLDPAGDPEETKGRDPDYTVVLTTGKSMSTGDIFVLDYRRDRLNPSEAISELFKQVRRYKPVKVRIESVAYQNTLLYWIREQMKKEDLHFIVEGLTHGRKAKNARILGLVPTFSNKFIHIKKWMRTLEDELLTFPIGAHDDIIDALSMMLGLWQVTTIKKYIPTREEDPLALIGVITELRARAESRPKISSFYEQQRDVARVAGWN